MSDSPLASRKLENLFYAQVDQDLLSKLRQKLEADQNAQEIMQHTGITDPAVAEHLANLNVTADTLTAFCLFPLVAVAWADDRVEENERFVITQAAAKAGLAEDSPAMTLLESWTKTRPSSEMLETWFEYAKEITVTMPDSGQAAFQSELLKQVNAVAEAAGGFYGYGSVSPNEKTLIEKISEALS